MPMICAFPDCNKGPLATGDALFRINPKGKGNGFIGMCEDHVNEDELDHVVKEIVDALQGKT